MPTLPRPGQKTAMISSTSLDLPEHRKQVIEACLRQGFHPIAMEHLPACNIGPTVVDTEMLDQADVYIGIYAWRYGEVPKGQTISYTEMEFNRAVELGIPILVFTIHDDHPLTIKMVETDTVAQKKLGDLKKRACDGRIRAEFKSPDDLRAAVIDALSDFREREIRTQAEKTIHINFHPPNLIPAAPIPYIAHPYSLLQTSEVVGRHHELKLLTDWVTTNKHIPQGIRIFNVVAIGGMGKSALTWKWFNDIAPNELPHLAGRIWWSFYESDAHFENFVVRALAYTAGMTEAAVRELPTHEREDRLFYQLDQEPFLLVLDGLERILRAYSRMDAPHVADHDLDERTANFLATVYGLSDEVKETYLEKHYLRQCADQRAGRFLRRLTRVQASRVLVSTRLYPAELQTTAAQPWPGCYAVFLKGLTDDDALALWRAFIGGERSGTSERLLPLFRSFGNYPLLLRALAGEVASYRSDPGNFDLWHKDHPDFNPVELSMKNAKTHVLKYALEGLSAPERHVLHTIAAFRMPTTWDSLCALLVEDLKSFTQPATPVGDKTIWSRLLAIFTSEAEKRTKENNKDKRKCQDDRELDAILSDLEDRGLVGWDKAANRYDLHPIVRGVVWQTLDTHARRDIYTELHTYFDAAPKPPKLHMVESLDDLTAAIELFNALIGLDQYEQAYIIFRDYLSYATHYRLSASRTRIELLEHFFPDGVVAPPKLADPRCQSFILNALATAYHLSGEPNRAVPLYRNSLEIDEKQEDMSNASIELSNLSDALRFVGHLREADIAASCAININMTRGNNYRGLEIEPLYFRGLVLASCGQTINAKELLFQALDISVSRQNQQREGLVHLYLAQSFLWFSRADTALPLALRASKLAQAERRERDLIRATRLHGEAALGVYDLTTASERLHHALTRARAVNLAEEELPALAALAELYRQQKEYDTTRELLDQAWALAERGPYPLFHADALNVLAQLERDAGNTAKAIEAATQAYRLAWCDGPPYAYHWGLEAARKHLRELGAPEPEMPPFDPSKFEPMPEVEINPKDEFYVEIEPED